MNTKHMNTKVTKKLNILLVDDDSDYLFQKQLELEEFGHKVKTFLSAKEAREYIKHNMPDVAIIDLMMEEMDAGIVLSYDIKKLYPKLPVIMATAVTNQTRMTFDRSNNELDKSWIKADAVLTKPVRLEQLLKEIERLVF